MSAVTLLDFFCAIKGCHLLLEFRLFCSFHFAQSTLLTSGIFFFECWNFFILLYIAALWPWGKPHLCRFSLSVDNRKALSRAQLCSTFCRGGFSPPCVISVLWLKQGEGLPLEPDSLCAPRCRPEAGRTRRRNRCCRATAKPSACRTTYPQFTCSSPSTTSLTTPLYQVSSGWMKCVFCIAQENLGIY